MKQIKETQQQQQQQQQQKRARREGGKGEKTSVDKLKDEASNIDGAKWRCWVSRSLCLPPPPPLPSEIVDGSAGARGRPLSPPSPTYTPVFPTPPNSFSPQPPPAALQPHRGAQLRTGNAQERRGRHLGQKRHTVSYSENKIKKT